MITVNDVSLNFSGQTLFKHVDLKFVPGNCYGIIGANGAGKTTFLRILSGDLEPTTGEVVISKEDRMSVLKQDHFQYDAYTVLDTVLMGTTGTLQLAQRPGKAQLEAAHRALEQLEIAHLANRGISQVSGGERQLALIARALVQNAAVLIMDEPTANLDYGNQQRVMARVGGLTHQGYTVLVSTHNPEHALRYASQVLALQDGSLCAFGPTAQTLTPDLIDKLYGIHVTMAEVMTPQGPACSLIALEE